MTGKIARYLIIFVVSLAISSFIIMPAVYAVSPSGKVSSTWGEVKGGDNSSKTAPSAVSCRQVVVDEAWKAMTGYPPQCGGIFYKGYLCGKWNYLASDKSALNYVKSIFVGDLAGWSPKDPDQYGYCVSFGINPPGTVKIGRGGQCFFFVNLVLYRSGADKNVQAHCNWNTISLKTAPIDLAKAGDVIFTRAGSGANYNHIAIVVYRSGNSIGLIESNYVEPNPNAVKGYGEIISYRSTTISALKNTGYKVYTGVTYY